MLNLVPKLRFPEFHNIGDWEYGSLEDKEISEFIKDRIPLNKLDINSYISTLNLLPDFAGIKTATKLPPSGSFTQFIKNDVLISNIRPYLKKVWQAQMNGSASNDVIVIRAKNKIVDNFLMHILKNDDFINYVMKDVKGVKMPRGDISSIKKYPLCYPSNKEQQKIADCLSSLDALITAHSQKHEALKSHKKGLMQQLFPKEGDKIPRLRFKEFIETGEWVNMELGSLCSIARSGGTPTSTNKTYYNGNIPFLAISDITKQGKYLISTSKNITQNGLDNSASWIVPINTIIYSMYASVGFVSINKIPLATSQAVINLILKDNICIEYVYYFLLDYKQYIHKFIETGTQGNLNAKSVKSLKINLPKELKEQQKIANCLASLDNLISTQAEKITTLKAHKKGLMQQLFVSN
jgi:type I restriction enzyme S subunit